MDIPPVWLLCRRSTFSGQARVIQQNSLLCARSVHSGSGCRPANMQAFPSPMRPLKRSHSHIRTFRKVLAVLVELFPQTGALPLKPSFCSSPRANSCSIGAGLAICRGNTGDKWHCCGSLARLHAIHAAICDANALSSWAGIVLDDHCHVPARGRTHPMPI